MSQVNLSKHVAADVDTVFKVYADMANAADKVSGIVRIEMLTDGPVDVGTRFRETRVMFKKEHSEEMEFTEFTPGKSYTLMCDSCGAVYESRFTFEGANGGTNVNMATNCRPTSFMAKLMAPVGWLMMGTMKKMIDKDMEDLKAAIENGKVEPNA